MTQRHSNMWATRALPLHSNLPFKRHHLPLYVFPPLKLLIQPPQGPLGGTFQIPLSNRKLLPHPYSHELCVSITALIKHRVLEILVFTSDFPT